MQLKNTPHVRDDFDVMTDQMRAFIRDSQGPYFYTLVPDIDKIFLQHIKSTHRQHHNCRCCLKFMRDYGSLVTIEAGRVVPLLWKNPNAFPKLYQKMVQAVHHAVLQAPIEGLATVPENGEAYLGHADTGEFTHFKFKLLLAAPSVAQAAKDRLGRMNFACSKWADVTIGKLDAVIGLTDQTMQGTLRAQLATLARWRSATPLQRWLFAAQEDEAGTHPNSSLIGKALDSLTEGKNYKQVAAFLKEQTDGLNYKRTTAPASETLIEEADRVFVNLNIANHLKRRIATVHELLPDAIWTPKLVREPVVQPQRKLQAFTPLQVAAAARKTRALPHVSVTVNQFLHWLPRIASIKVIWHGLDAGRATMPTAGGLTSPFFYQKQMAWYWYAQGSQDSVPSLRDNFAQSLIKGPTTGTDYDFHALVFLCPIRASELPHTGLFSALLQPSLAKYGRVVEDLANNMQARRAVKAASGSAAAALLQLKTGLQLMITFTDGDTQPITFF